jgi:hypothetical protein
VQSDGNQQGLSHRGVMVSLIRSKVGAENARKMSLSSIPSRTVAFPRSNNEKVFLLKKPTKFSKFPDLEVLLLR